MIICLLSLCVGALLALFVPVAQFVLGLVAAALLGAGCAWLEGGATGTIWLWTALLYVAAQVGYALGIVGTARLQGLGAFAERRKAALHAVRQPFLK